MPENPSIRPRTIVALALLAAVSILGYEGVLSTEVVSMLLVSIAGGYGFVRRRHSDTSDGGDAR